jgi:hypothetical protein
MCLTVIDVCSLRTTVFAYFFGVMSIFTLTKRKIISGFKISMHLWKTQSVNWWSGNLSHSNPSELVCKPVPSSQRHAFTETRGKEPSFVYLQPTELDFYQNKCLFQLICTLLYLW